MMRQDRGDTFDRKSEVFPYMPLHSDISDSDNTFRSREKTNMTSSFKGGGFHPEKNQRNNVNHHQHKPFPIPIGKLALPKLDYNSPRRRYAGGSTIRQMDGLSANIPEEIINPEPAPFKSQDFMSSTVMKNVSISKRHLDNFTSLDNLYSGKRGFALHTQRYNWDTSKSLDSMTQRDRLIAEIESLERLRDIRRKTEILPHRLPLDMYMGGKRLDIEERFDINREIRRLKAMVLPQYAKDLYHGRGIHLPSNHASIKPRKAPIPDNDSDDGITNSAPGSLIRRTVPKCTYGSETSRLPQQKSFADSLPQTQRKEILPKINRNQSLGFDIDVSLSRSNPNMLPSLHRNPASWVQEQNQHLQEKKEVASTENEIVDERIPETKYNRSNSDAVTPGPPPPTAGVHTVTPSRYSVSPAKAITPYPLRGSELVSNVPDDRKETLKETFKKLDTDADGHLNYNQLRPELPSEFSPSQEQFLKQVYDITSSSSFFGVDEFLTMTQLGQTIQELGDEAKEAYKILEDGNINQLIIHYVDLFQSVDRNQSGQISMNSLKEILSTALEINLESQSTLWNKIINTVNMVKADQITKLEYLAHLPYFHQLSNNS